MADLLRREGNGQQVWSQAWSEALSGQGAVVELAWDHPNDGAHRPRLTLAPKEEGGRVTGVTVYSVDVEANMRRMYEAESTLRAIDQTQAVVEFAADGKILNANAVFLQVMGYTLDEIQGKQHSMFVDPKEAASPDYRIFWNNLEAGKFSTGAYRRLDKDGREVYLSASYCPVTGEDGKISRLSSSPSTSPTA